MQLGASLPSATSAPAPPSSATMRRPPKGSASTISWRPTMCWAPTRRRYGGEPASAPPPPPITIRSCCSAFSPASRSKIGFAAGVLILAQRQAALVAKQAACLDALCERPLSPRRRRRLERDRVPGAGRGLPHSRQALGGAGALHAGAVGQAARNFKGEFHRSTMAASTRGPSRARCRSGSAAMPRRPSGARRSMATASCRSPIRPATRR